MNDIDTNDKKKESKQTQPVSDGLYKCRAVSCDPLTADTKLYRYISLSQFISWIETKHTYLKRVIEWDDTHELPIRKRVIGWGEDAWNLMNQYFPQVYGQCWCYSGESDAMWRMYSPNSEGLMIETSVKKFDLIQGLKFAMISSVYYTNNPSEFACTSYEEKGKYIDWLTLMEMNPHTDVPCPKLLIEKQAGKNIDIDLPVLMCISAFVKRAEFTHENEVRLAAFNPRSFEQPVPKDSVTVSLPLNPREFIEGITIDPRASDWYVDTIERYCKRYRLSITPVKSKLYEPIKPWIPTVE